MNKEIKNQVQTELKQNGNAGPGTELVNKEREEKLSENEVFELIQKIKEIEEQKEELNGYKGGNYRDYNYRTTRISLVPKSS
ncbi:hypothetical protein C2G38_2154194 [Gigaspora rosea]|uniref:Uncharacterized protein n=1 Tax=Gigaspora rosea TaxID=44941 RepID=A0A397W761_9GLOM|nr:hypothetical protein C2G38_2154194 [Gigaspora rosea]